MSEKKHEVMIHGKTIPVHTDKVIITGTGYANDSDPVEVMLSSNAFNQCWLDRIDSDTDIVEIHIQSIDFLPNGEILFIKPYVLIRDPDGKIYPRTFLIRKDVVSCFIVLVCEGKEYVVMITQPRAATGYSNIKSIVAGIIDDGETAEEAVIRETLEETGITITQDCVVDLVREIYGEIPHGLFLAPGTTNDNCRHFAAIKEISVSELSKLQNSLAGAAGENERILVQVLPIDEFISNTTSSNSISAFALYHHYKERKECND